MKRFFKFCGIVALVLGMIGLILWGIGTSAVGMENISDTVDKLTEGHVKLDFEGLKISIGDALDSHAIYDINDMDMFDKENDIWKGDVEKTLIAEGSVRALDIEAGGCMLKLKDSEDDAYYVEYTGTGKSQAYVDGDELYVKVLNSVEWNISGWNEADEENCLTLYVPLDTILEEINLELGAGQVTLDDLKAGEIEINIGGGQILADGMQAENLAVTVGAGDIVMENVNIQTLQTEVGAGNCEIAGNITGDIKMECAMGNITLELDDSEENYNYEIECVSGNITIGEKEYSGLTQEQIIDNNAAKSMELECAMGNVEVVFE